MKMECNTKKKRQSKKNGQTISNGWNSYYSQTHTHKQYNTNIIGAKISIAIVKHTQKEIMEYFHYHHSFARHSQVLFHHFLND